LLFRGGNFRLKGGAKTLATQPPRAILAELWGDFFGGFQDVIKNSHPFAYRAFLRKDNYNLELRDAATRPTKDVYDISPTYVFLNSRL